MKKFKARNAVPMLLTVLGGIGVVATAVLTAQATPLAVQQIHGDSRQNHDGDPCAYTTAEAIRSAWKYYVPAFAVGTSTIVCIFGANILNQRQQAAITSAYALLNEAYRDYTRKTKEIFGEEGHKQIMEAIAVEKAHNVYMSSPSICECGTLAFDDRDQEDKRLFYDTFSKRYFESTVPQVLEAEYHLNRNWVLGMVVCVNDFYDFLGVDKIPGGDELQWFYEDEIGWIDFNHQKMVLDDGLEVLAIDMVFAPRLWTGEC